MDGNNLTQVTNLQLYRNLTTLQVAQQLLPCDT